MNGTPYIANNTPVEFPGLGLTFNPDWFVIPGLPLRWYGLIIAIGFALAVIYAYRNSKRFGIREEELIDMLIPAAIIGIVCARLYYVLFKIPNFYVEGDPAATFLNIVRIQDGGLAIYGGIIGAVLTALVFCHRRKIKFGAMADLCCFGLLIGQMIGRWGNFVNREAFGGETDLPWRMGLTDVKGNYWEVHPTFFYESMWNLVGFLLLRFIAKRFRKYDGQIFTMYVAWYGLGRAMVEGLRADSLYFMEEVLGQTIRVSQLVALLSFIVAVCLLIWQLVFRKHSPEQLQVNLRDLSNEKIEKTENGGE